MVLNLEELIGACDTADQGIYLKQIMIKFIPVDGSVTLDFQNIAYATTSFVNTSFVDLTEEYGYDFVRSNIKIINANPQIAAMIRNRVSTVFEKKMSVA